MVLIHQRVPPAQGDHPQNWRATANTTTGQADVIFLKPRVRRSRSRGQFDKSPYGQSEISSTSCLSACWRLWCSRCYRCTVSLGLLSAVRCPLVCYSALVVVFTYGPPHRAYPGSKHGRRATSLWLWSFRSSRTRWLGLCVVQGSARPEPVDRLLNSSSAHMSKEESTRSMFLGDMARTDKPFDGNAVVVGPICLRLKRSVPRAILLWCTRRTTMSCCQGTNMSQGDRRARREGAYNPIHRGRRFGMDSNLMFYLSCLEGLVGASTGWSPHRGGLSCGAQLFSWCPAVLLLRIGSGTNDYTSVRAIGVVSCEFERYANFTHLFCHAVVNAVASAFTRICHL